jgi:hypothetical protein
MVEARDTGVAAPSHGVVHVRLSTLRSGAHKTRACDGPPGDR